VESFGRFAQLFDLYNRPVTSATPGQADFPQLGISSAAASIAGATSALNSGGGAPLDLATEISRLKTLKDQGVISEEEFQKAKAKLLAQP
jgi:multidrug resistance efflux pump